MEMRKLSLRADLLGDKKVDYNLYGHLQALSYLKDGKRFVYASEATPSKLLDMTPTEDGKKITSLATIKRVMKFFKDSGLITEGKVEDLAGKQVKCYWLNEDENYFQLINLETLRFLCDVANSDVIKTYAYLLNKNNYFEDYSFSCKEIVEMLGYYYKADTAKKAEHILFALESFGLIKTASYYEKNFDGAPVPRKRLISVKTNVKGLK